MKYSLVKQAKQPTRGHYNDAGLDIYVPKFNKQFMLSIYQMNSADSFFFITEQHKLGIAPHKRIKLPTGLHFNIPSGNILLVLQKTSVPNKTGIISGARVIDQNYQGQFIASLINTSDTMAYLQQDQKFIQLVLSPVSYPTLQKVELIDLYEEESDRGAGAFGSTGLK